ncbi:hypothetical protein HR45_12790 [Shewanella mangrovi]|uniref:Uncharacterized protein n=2 Tax=Shewanella mangrovi TaxID=1515746 RepID=A0A094JGE6_9GAMM|nr:hypothetical protein HR45_12790 [Shewanella mangrovi]
MEIYSDLKARHRAERANYPHNLTLRVHRSLSWLNNAEQQRNNDSDSAFIFYWIAFNAAYGFDVDSEYRHGEKQSFRDFLTKIVALDSEQQLEKLVWQKFSGPIRVLLDNQYVFQPFWDFHNQRIDETEWTEKFKTAKAAAHTAMTNRSTEKVLAIVCDRLYTLRNQLIHGGATWQSAANRDAMRDCTEVMACLVPTVIGIMMDHPNTLWGAPIYPIVD